MRFACLAVLLCAGCVSVGDVRAKPAMFEGASAKSVNSVSACVATALQAGPGVLVSTVPLENGMSVIQSAHTPQGITPFIITDIVAVDGRTKLSIRANGRKPRDPAKSFKGVVHCL